MKIAVENHYHQQEIRQLMDDGTVRASPNHAIYKLTCKKNN